MVKSIYFQAVNNAGRGILGYGIDRHGRPEAGIADHLQRVLFTMIEDDLFRINPPVPFQVVKHHLRPLEFIF